MSNPRFYAPYFEHDVPRDGNGDRNSSSGYVTC